LLFSRVDVIGLVN